jgi:hypothetical protein
MKSSNGHAAETASTKNSRVDDPAERQKVEAEHWETLNSLLTQMPPADLATAPLLKSASPCGSITMVRSTAERFPLPSVVPCSQAQEQPHSAEPITKQVDAHTTGEQVNQQRETKSMRAEHTEPRKRSGSHESWTERMSQRVLSTLGQKRPSRISTIRPANQAEVAYNPQGKVDYVTYTINAPARKGSGSH